MKAKARLRIGAISPLSLDQRLVEAFWRLIPAFGRWCDSHAAERSLGPQRMRVLDLLTERGPQIMRDLRDELGVTATNITALVDALEKEGLVSRRPHPSDRRATVIALAPEAPARIRRSCDSFKSQVATLFEDLPERDRRELLRLLDSLLESLRARGILE